MHMKMSRARHPGLYPYLFVAGSSKHGYSRRILDLEENPTRLVNDSQYSLIYQFLSGPAMVARHVPAMNWTL